MIKLVRKQILKSELNDPKALKQWSAEETALERFRGIGRDLVDLMGTPVEGTSRADFERATRQLQEECTRIEELRKEDRPERGTDVISDALDAALR